MHCNKKHLACCSKESWTTLTEEDQLNLNILLFLWTPPGDPMWMMTMAIIIVAVIIEVE